MSEAKHFKISGEVVKPILYAPMKFSIEIAAPNRSRAIEKIYADLGSRHKAKRHQIRIHQVEELEPVQEATKKVDR